MPTKEAVYDGKAHAEAREARLECSHVRLTFQAVVTGKPLYCIICKTDKKVAK